MEGDILKIRDPITKKFTEIGSKTWIMRGTNIPNTVPPQLENNGLFIISDAVKQMKQILIVPRDTTFDTTEYDNVIVSDILPKSVGVGASIAFPNMVNGNKFMAYALSLNKTTNTWHQLYWNIDPSTKYVFGTRIVENEKGGITLETGSRSIFRATYTANSADPPYANLSANQTTAEIVIVLTIIENGDLIYQNVNGGFNVIPTGDDLADYIHKDYFKPIVTDISNYFDQHKSGLMYMCRYGNVIEITMNGYDMGIENEGKSVVSNTPLPKPIIQVNHHFTQTWNNEYLCDIYLDSNGYLILHSIKSAGFSISFTYITNE